MAMIRARSQGGYQIPLLNIRLGKNEETVEQCQVDLFTDLAGNTSFNLIASAPYYADASGFTLYTNHRNVQGQFTQVTQRVNDFAQDVDVIVPQAPLHIAGRDFVSSDGQRVVLNGCDGFMDYRIFLDGGENALRPHLQEAASLGFTARRVFMQGSKAQNQVMDLWPTEADYYNRLRAFVQFENSMGLTPLLTIGVDNQDVRSPIAHWVRVDELTRDLPRIISFFNEAPKNMSDFGPEDIPPASGMWSRGSSLGDELPPVPQGPVMEFHPVRNYTTAMRDAVASPIELYEVQFYSGPLIIDEPGRMGTNAHDPRFSDPVEVERYARLLSTLSAGVVMHNYFGQRGQLMDGLTRQCAEAWTRGVFGV